MQEAAGSGGTGFAHAEQAGATATMPFLGTGLRWIGSRGPGQGRARVRIDGELRATVDQYASETQREVTSLAIEGLERDYHTVEIEVLEARDPKATASRVVLDAFDVLP